MSARECTRTVIVVLSFSLCLVCMVLGAFTYKVKVEMDEMYDRIAVVERRCTRAEQELIQIESDSIKRDLELSDCDSSLKNEIKDLHDYVSLRKW